MKYNPDIHHRRSIRLRNYDYSQAGAYFVTICVQGRECLFGEITNRIMRLNDAGNIVAEKWKWLEKQYNHVELDEWGIMPNHMHGIIVITDVGRGGSRTAPTYMRTALTSTAPTKRKPLGRLIGAFKTVSTKHVNILRDTSGNRLWQRDYWDHVIRNENELHRIREYIRNNPARWREDALHPDQPPFPGETRESSPPYGDEAWMV
jgi:REP element-mobilizing transposase RayT